MAALQELYSEPGGRASRVLPRCTQCVWGGWRRQVAFLGVHCVLEDRGWESQASGSAAVCRHAFWEWGRAAVRGLLLILAGPLPLPSLYLRMTG